MKKVLKFVSLALCIAVFCGIFAACGQTEEPSQTAAGGEEVSDAPDDGSSYVFTVATRAAEGDLVSSTVTWFADEISARTEGRVTLDIQYNGVLCAQGTEFEALESGICDIASPRFLPTRAAGLRWAGSLSPVCSAPTWSSMSV